MHEETRILYCPHCGAELVRTEGGHYACPEALHGKIISRGFEEIPQEYLTWKQKGERDEGRQVP
jgi:hypothetical protein